MSATMQRETRKEVEPNRQQEFVTPEVNIFETPEGYVLEAEMPGVNKSGLEITLEGNEITITGRRTTEHLPGEVIMSESHHAGFRRVFELDPMIDTAKVTARMEQGVLTLTLPKSERVKPRRISVD